MAMDRCETATLNFVNKIRASFGRAILNDLAKGHKLLAEGCPIVKSLQIFQKHDSTYLDNTSIFVTDKGLFIWHEDAGKINNLIPITEVVFPPQVVHFVKEFDRGTKYDHLVQR